MATLVGEEGKSKEGQFKEALADVLVVIRELAPVCTSTAELIEILELAEVNPSQLRIVMAKVLKQQLR